MKIAICDDMHRQGEYIRDILVKKKSLEECALFADGKELLTLVEQGCRYDVYFLDIEMPTIDGLTLGKSIRALHPMAIIVFTTAYSQYVFDSFDCEPFHYLVKPIEEERLLSVFEKACQKYKQINHYHNITVKNRSVRLKIEDIYYVECCQKHILYHTSDTTYDTLDKLSNVYATLHDFGFCQVHQGYLVNMEKIKHFDDIWVVLVNDCRVPMSVRKKKEVILEYSRFIRK